jgi:uncharacterized protein
MVYTNFLPQGAEKIGSTRSHKGKNKNKHMKLIQLFAAVLFASAPLFAQQKEDNSLLWEITGKDLQKPSYLFGTIHIICKEDFFMPDVVKQKFAASNNIFLELDMDDPGMQMKVVQLALLPQGQSLQQLFGADYNAVDSFFKKNSAYPLAMFNQFKPMMIMSLLYLEMLPCETQESYEQSFIAMAKEAGKNIQGLETMEDQMKVFDDIPDSVEIKNIVKLIKEYDAQAKQFSAMVKVYKEQNVTRLQQEVVSSPDIWMLKMPCSPNEIITGYR